jgi:ubiquinone/menaquinone biosynthesis C-methylase UbiE
MHEHVIISQEFGLSDEAQAVKAYRALNQDFMSANYPLLADEIISRRKLDKCTILDVGTGLGSLALEFAKRLPKAKIYGLDISPEMLKEAKKAAEEARIKHIEFVYGDACAMKFPDSLFDLVVSFGVLHHLADLKLFFSQLKRVLKKGAVAYLYDLQKDVPEETVAQIASAMPELPRKAFLESVKSACSRGQLEKTLRQAAFSDFALSAVSFSRQTIVKNKETLRKSKFLGEKFNQILFECRLSK